MTELKKCWKKIKHIYLFLLNEFHMGTPYKF